jgi:enoyl-CoA hydratase
MNQTHQYETILWNARDGIAEIRLNRPHRLNAVVERLYLDVLAGLDRAAAAAEIRTVKIIGEGRAFCVGADLKEHAAGQRSPLEQRRYLQLGNEVCERIVGHPKPVVAAVNGYALGAGAEIAVSCDFLLMKAEAEIGFPEVSIGTFIGGGVSHLLPRLVGLAKARELIMLGRRVNGIEAEAMGLAIRAYPADSFDDAVDDFAADLASKAPYSLRFAKEHMNAAHRDYATTLVTELEALRACMATEDWKEGVAAFAEKRQPVFQGR